MSNNTLLIAKKIVAKALGFQVEDIHDDCSIFNFRDWDSLAQVQIMVFMSENYEIEFNEANFKNFSSLVGIIDYLNFINSQK
jgi:acyl carrier protein